MVSQVQILGPRVQETSSLTKREILVGRGSQNRSLEPILQPCELLSFVPLKEPD